MTYFTPIEWKTIAASAIARGRSLLPELIPGGRFEGNEYIALNPLRADKNPGSFKINSRTGMWSDFATGAKGNDIIGWHAHARGLDQGEAARQIAEKLGVATNRSKDDISRAPTKIHSFGDKGPPVRHDEVRRHYYPKRGEPKVKVKIKKRDGAWINCFRVFDNNKPGGWQYKKPADFRPAPYFGEVRDSRRIFWTEGEKDTDTLDGLGLPTFTFGGTGDGLPDGVDRDLKALTGRLLVIVTDNDEPGRAHARKKADIAHASGVKHIRIFDPKSVWSNCGEGEDITDWFEKGGGTREKLIEITNDLPDWKPSASSVNNDTVTDKNNEGASWDYPDLSLLDDRRGELPPFPLEVLSPAWQSWATNAAHGAGTTVDHVLVPLLSIASSLIGTARRLRPSTSWSQPFSLWTAIVGDSGTGKTPGLAVSQRTLLRIERNRKHHIGELRRAHESRIEIAKTAKKQWQQQVEEAVQSGQKPPDMPADAEIPEPFEAPRLFVSSATIEKLTKLLLARPQGMLQIADELAGLFLNLSRYSGGSDREFWLEAWNGQPYRVERLNRPPVDVEHLLVGLTGGFQPDKLAKSFDGDADGIYARVLFSWPTEAPYRPLTDSVNEIDPELENALAKLIDLAEFEGDKLVIRNADLTPDARSAFDQFRETVYDRKGGLEGRERDWWVKTPAHVLRLAGTLAYQDWAMESVGTTTIAPTIIEVRFVNAAIQLVVEYFWPHARAALRQIGLTDGNAKARRLLRWLRYERKELVSIEDIRRDALQQSLNADATTKLVEALVKAGWLRKVPTENTGPGRPARRWLVNPALWAAVNDRNSDAEDHLTPAAEIAEIAQIPPANSTAAISAISAISATAPELTSDDAEATWTV